jgi:hypothetical protein
VCRKAPVELGRRFGKVPMNLIRFSLISLVLASCLSSCAPAGPPIPEGQYAAKILGDWEGTVGETKETISFSADGKFKSKVRPGGFINSTLGQGTTGTIGGKWTIEGKVVTLKIDSAENVALLNKTTTSTIESFKQYELVIRSSTGETSSFIKT